MRVRGKSPWQRIVSLALCMTMLLTLLPVTAWAVNEADDTVELLSADEAAVEKPTGRCAAGMPLKR